MSLCAEPGYFKRDAPRRVVSLRGVKHQDHPESNLPGMRGGVEVFYLQKLSKQAL